MENFRKWNPMNDLEDTEELLSSGAPVEEVDDSIEDILREYGVADSDPIPLTHRATPAAEKTEQPAQEPEPFSEASEPAEELSMPPEAPAMESAVPEAAEPDEAAEVPAVQPEERIPEPPASEAEPEAEPAAEETEHPAESAAEAPEEPAEEPGAEQPEEQKPAEAEPMDASATAAFIGQQVSDAISEVNVEPTENNTTVNGLRQFFVEARRRTAEKKLRREQRLRERAAAAAMAEAAAAVKEEEEEAKAEAQQAESNVVQMPVSRMKPLRDSFGHIHDKANDFADNMYNQAGTAEQDATGEFVMGTDMEEEVKPPKVSWRERLPRKQFPKEPDTSAEELASRYRLGLRFMKQRLVYVFLLAALLLYLSIAEGLGLPLPAALLNHRITSGILTWCLAFGAAIGLDVIWLGLTAPFRGRTGMHTLTALSVIATLLDGLFSTLIGRDGPLPVAAMALFGLFFAMLGAYQRKLALYLACRTAASAAEPYRVTLDPNKWDGVAAFNKEAGTAEGFGSQIQSRDGAERIYRIWVPLIGAAAVLCSIIASVGQGRPGMLTWCLSSTLVAASPLTGLMAFGYPYLKLTRRLDRSGAVLAGWDGVESMAGKANILVKDEDLFPEGSVIMKSIKHFDGVSLEKLTGCTASMLRAAGSGLYHLFDSELRRQGGFYRRVDDLQCYEAGGLTADIRGDQVLVGTSGFMTVMDVKLEDGMKVKRAVYCVINRTLQGIFTLEYEMSHYAKTAIDALVRGGVKPVLVTRDFNVIPSMLQNRHDLPVDEMEYPPIERRRELSEPGQPHNPTLGALLTREGMGSYSDAIIGGRRLRTVVRLNAIIAVLASLVGVLLAFYLTFALAFDSLTPLSMMAFLLLWAIPTVVISGVIDRF